MCVCVCVCVRARVHVHARLLVVFFGGVWDEWEVGGGGEGEVRVWCIDGIRLT